MSEIDWEHLCKLSEVENARLTAENARLKSVVSYVDSWVSNPVSSYSVMALDGLFLLTRDRIAALETPNDR